MIKIIHVESEGYIRCIRELFKEYAASLGFDLCFQNFDKELAGLPGEYAQPDGCLILALYDTEIAGCAALRKITNGVCEMKRLYVRPEFRGKGIGRGLAKAIIESACKMGYKCMRLDTVLSMKEAMALYRSMGFRDCESYRHNPIQGAMFMELDLRKI